MKQSAPVCANANANARTRTAPKVFPGKKSVSTAAKPRRRAAAGSGRPLSAEERDRLIREAAYLRAERRGFAADSALEDWLAAEAEIDGALGNT